MNLKAFIRQLVFSREPERLGHCSPRLSWVWGQGRGSTPVSGEEARTSGLSALTLAAMALPGLSQAAPGDLVSAQYGQYMQTPWQLYDGLKSQYSPLRAENISAQGLLTFPNRIKFSLNYQQDVWSGATPVASAPNALGGNNPTKSGASPLIRGNGTIAYDKQLNPYAFNSETAQYSPDNRLEQTIAMASPEIRNQGDFRLGYEWDEAALNVGGGVSQEPDYSSSFASVNGRMDFNRKLTVLNGGVNYTNSSVNAIINPLFAPYVDTSNYTRQIQIEPGPGDLNTQIMTGVRQDWSSHLSLSQVINKDLVLESSVGYIRSTGYLANPYKAVDFVFVDTSADPIVNEGGLPPLYAANVQGVLEKRPNERNQGVWDIRMVQYVEPFDASIHAGYRYFHDDWGIEAHTFDVDWVQPLGSWSVTPRVRYYSQTQADFYQPYFLFNGAAPQQGDSPAFNLAGVPIANYSSDYRLSAYGAIGAGLTINKQFGKALGIEAGFEYYTHAGSLALGNNGQGSWADFDYYQFNAALKVDPSAVSLAEGDSDSADHDHMHHHDHGDAHLGMHAPAGVLYSHLLDKAGDTMVGVRYGYMIQGGPIMSGTSAVSDNVLAAQGCGGTQCQFAPQDMTMNMYMIDLMYAPTDWLTLMVMPQFMSNNMNLRQLPGGAEGATLSGAGASGGVPVSPTPSGSPCTASSSASSSPASARPASRSSAKSRTSKRTQAASATTASAVGTSFIGADDGGVVDNGTLLPGQDPGTPWLDDGSDGLSGSGGSNPSPETPSDSGGDSGCSGSTAATTTASNSASVVDHSAHGSTPYHASGGVGDTGLYALVKLFSAPGHKLHATVGFSAPTGSVSLRYSGNSQYEHYGMQTGSGVWEFRPSLTYNGRYEDAFWGGQAYGQMSLESQNSSGYLMGDLFQVSGWGGYNLTNWLSGTTRLLYTQQNAIEGQFVDSFAISGPMDMPASYGGNYLDVGFGLDIHITQGEFAGNHIGVEWLQPVYCNYNGYQLERTGSLFATWGLSF